MSPSGPAPTPPPAPRRVCHLRATNFFGGPEKQILRHCLALDRTRWTPLVATFPESAAETELSRRATAAGIEGLPLGPTPGGPLQLLTLRRRLLTHAVDLVVGHGYKADILAFLATVGVRIPVLAYFRGYTGEDRRVRLYERIDRALLRLFPRVLTVSDASRAMLVAAGVPAERLVTVHNAIDADDLAPSPAPIRTEFSIAPDCPVLVAAGRLSPEKGHRFLLAALVAGEPLLARAHAVLLGEGREEAALRRQAQAAGCAERVHFAGFKQDPLAYLAAADVVVNPSTSEGLPNVVLEACRVAAPIVATDVGGTREVIRDGETGRLAAPADAAALARRLAETLADRDGARAMARRAQQDVAGRFSFAAQAAQLMAVYDGVAGPRGER